MDLFGLCGDLCRWGGVPVREEGGGCLAHEVEEAHLGEDMCVQEVREEAVEKGGEERAEEVDAAH